MSDSDVFFSWLWRTCPFPPFFRVKHYGCSFLGIINWTFSKWNQHHSGARDCFYPSPHREQVLVRWDQLVMSQMCLKSLFVLISKSMLISVKVLKRWFVLRSRCTSHFYNLLILHRAVSLLFISNRFETSLFTGKTSVFSSAGQRALSSAELGAFIRASYRPKTFLSTDRQTNGPTNPLVEIL